MDQSDPTLDHLRLDVPDHRHSSGRLLGVLRIGLGWLLGLGPGGKCVVHALAGGHRLFAFRVGAREAKNVQSLEFIPDYCHVFAFAYWNFFGAQRSAHVGAFLCHRPRARPVYFNFRRHYHRHCLRGADSPISQTEISGRARFAHLT